MVSQRQQCAQCMFCVSRTPQMSGKSPAATPCRLLPARPTPHPQLPPAVSSAHVTCMHHRHWLVLHHWSKRANLTARHGRRALRLGLIPALTVTMTASIRCANVTAAIATLLQGLVGAGEGRGLPAAAVDAVTGEVGQCLAANSRIDAVIVTVSAGMSPRRSARLPCRAVRFALFDQ